MSEHIFTLSLNLSYLFCILSLFIVLFLKLKQIKNLRSSVNYLQKSLEEMDEQAKLIVRTDLELNKIQEELDKKITGLYALQRISQKLSNTLVQNEIFNRLNPEELKDLGFQKALIFIEDKNKKLTVRYNLGYSGDDEAKIKSKIEAESFYAVIRAKNSSFSSLSPDERTAGIVKSIFGRWAFIVAPLIKKEGLCGFIFLGNDPAQESLTAGDEEWVSILSTHIAQSLDNADLFEQTYLQHQELERKVLERTQELSAALNELKEVNKRKSDFVSAVTHELRTPLTSIKGYASILLSEKLGVIPEEAKSRLQKINQHSDELARLVNDLLDIARIESGRIALHLEALNIRSVLENAVDLLAPQLNQRNIKLEISAPDGLPFALADKTQITRVFINILGNAIKFVPENSGEIRISCGAVENFIQINIADNGIGISPQDTVRIFEEFYRADNTINQKVKGTGLGLALVKNIIQAHKGKIWVESRPNSGSTFSLTLLIAK